MSVVFPEITAFVRYVELAALYDSDSLRERSKQAPVPSYIAQIIGDVQRNARDRRLKIASENHSGDWGGRVSVEHELDRARFRNSMNELIDDAVARGETSVRISKTLPRDHGSITDAEKVIYGNRSGRDAYSIHCSGFSTLHITDEPDNTTLISWE